MPAEAKLTTTRLPSVTGEALAYQLGSQFFSFSGYGTSFCQRSLPSARARHRRLRTVPPWLAWVRKMRSPQRTGVELPGYSSGTFHLTFSLGPHVNGRPFSVEWPWPVGPRHAGQLSARATTAEQSNASRAQ